MDSEEEKDREFMNNWNFAEDDEEEKAGSEPIYQQPEAMPQQQFYSQNPGQYPQYQQQYGPAANYSYQYPPGAELKAPQYEQHAMYQPAPNQVA